MIMAEEDDAAADDEVDDPTEDDVTCLEEDGPIASVFGGLLGGTRPAAALLLLLLPLLFFAEPLFFDDLEFELPNDATELLDDIRIMPGIFNYYGLGCLCAVLWPVLSGLMPSLRSVTKYARSAWKVAKKKLFFGTIYL